MSHQWTGRVLLLTLLIISTGCEDEETIGPSPANNAQYESLSGRVLVVGSDALWQMDARSGKFSKVSETTWKTDPNYHNLANFLLSPIAYEGDEFILRVRNCLPSNFRTSCIVSLNKDATKTHQFSLSGRISRYAKMSRDRQYVALQIQYGISITNDTNLEIYDRNGNLISESVIADTSVFLSLDWLPDGSIAYSLNSGDKRSIYITSPYTTTVFRTLTLPPSMLGTVREIAVSPDGTKISFSLINSSSFAATVATPWVVNIDGTNMRQLAYDPHADDVTDTYINNPKWSPDGRWILVKYGGARGGPIGNLGVLGYLFAVPSDGTRVPLSPYDESIPSTAIQIKSDWYAAFYDRPNSTFNADRWPSRDYDWVR